MKKIKDLSLVIVLVFSIAINVFADEDSNKQSVLSDYQALKITMVVFSNMAELGVAIRLLRLKPTSELTKELQTLQKEISRINKHFWRNPNIPSVVELLQRREYKAALGNRYEMTEKAVDKWLLSSIKRVSANSNELTLAHLKKYEKLNKVKSMLARNRELNLLGRIGSFLLFTDLAGKAFLLYFDKNNISNLGMAVPMFSYYKFFTSINDVGEETMGLREHKKFAMNKSIDEDEINDYEIE